MKWWLVGVGCAIHLLAIYTLLDIYLTTTIIHGISPVHLDMEAPADRVVLVVIDGLRADIAFQPDPAISLPRAPFLHSIARTKGVWGVSHALAPTETRVGHVAMTAGMGEDYAGLLHGWEWNQEPFDTVFNQSDAAFLFGAPDVVPIFRKGYANPEKVVEEMYSIDYEKSKNYRGVKDAYAFDDWVEEAIRKKIKSAATDATLARRLKSKRVVWFAHLLGVDTNGHFNTPASYLYKDNVYSADRVVEKIYNTIEEFYGHDGKTAYIVTADHGHFDSGGHGDASPVLTRTPFLVFGAGIRKPAFATKIDNDAQQYGLGDIRRIDIQQIDIAPLIANLAGLTIPVNSVGKVPLDVLQGDELKAKAMVANAKQVLSHYYRAMGRIVLGVQA